MWPTIAPLWPHRLCFPVLQADQGRLEERLGCPEAFRADVEVIAGGEFPGFDLLDSRRSGGRRGRVATRLEHGSETETKRQAEILESPFT